MSQFNILVAVSAAVMGVAFLTQLVSFLIRRRTRTSVRRDIQAKRLAQKEEPEIPTEELFDYTRKEFSYISQLTDPEWEKRSTIGLVGIRGVGKTMLQQQILKTCEERGMIYFFVSCPTHIDEKQIVTNMFDRLCHAVLKRLSKDYGGFIPELKVGTSSLTRTPTTPIVFLFALILVIVDVAIAVTAGTFAFVNIPIYPIVTRIAVSIGSAFGAGLLVFPFLRSISQATRLPVERKIRTKIRDPSGQGKGQKVADLYVWTMEATRNLETEQRYTVEREGTLSPLSSIKLRLGRKEEVAKKPFTLPGLIDEYKDYIEVGIGDLYPGVVVAIDELDRVQDAQEVRSFLRRIKSLLSIDRVYYLMSVSEDVVDSFQLRSISSKGEADSAFSELVRLCPLDLEESLKFCANTKKCRGQTQAKVLAVLSGGIPRDIDRYARKLRSASQSLEGLLQAELDEMIRDFLIHVRHSDSFLAGEKTNLANTFADSTRRKDIDCIAERLETLVQPVIEGEADVFAHTSAIERKRAKMKLEGAILVLEVLIRLKVIAHLIQHLESDGDIPDDKAEALRQIVEWHTYSPIEAHEKLKEIEGHKP